MNIYAEPTGRTDYEKFKWIVAEIDHLINEYVYCWDEEFEAWHIKAERFLVRKFGENSFEHKKFLNTNFRPPDEVDYDGANEDKIFRSWCEEGLRRCRLAFETYLEDMADESKTTTQVAPNTSLKNMYRIFIVHGHDGELKQSVARIIEKQGIEAIILSEQANKGRTIIEKFEDYSDVGGAICLFTADDWGRAKIDTTDNTRARQNVVLETGYFMGKLGRDHVVLLADKGIEMPSDLSGVVYTDTGNWQFALLKELAAMGYKVDLNKLL
jgi:predicted nucleotide-binding protein